ncbi:hypothetical protein M569_11489, partial [Genlisea aurea]
IVFTVLTAAVALLTFFLFAFTRKRPKLLLPPGPPGKPLVGNLFQVALSGKPFFQYIRELLPQYGPIFTLRMGNRTMIIVSSHELAHEALIEKGQIFATRPGETATRAIFSCNKFTVNAALYGPVWRSLRRNMVQNMLSTVRIKGFSGTRTAAMDKLVERLRAEAEGNDGRVWVLKNSRFAVFCILLFMCFGLDIDEATIVEVDQIMKAVLIALDPRIDDFLPILSPFFYKQRKKVRQVRKKQMEILIPLIERRREAIRNPGSDGSSSAAAAFSYLDTIFDLKIEGRKTYPSDQEIVTLCSEFLNGGTDTTATAVEWGIARLIENPDVQSRLYEEIRTTVGSRKVEDKDIEKMPYLNAVVKELLRKHPPTYFVLSHAVTEPARLGGYEVPAGASVEFFSAAIAEDPKVWSDPQKFDPDRFFADREDADITGVAGVKMMPFGVGRRICPGLAIGTLHINLMLARMVQEFEWSGTPDFTEKFQFTVVTKDPLRATIKPR